MKVLLIAAAVLAAQTAAAEQRANKPFNTTNGRTTNSAPRVFAVTHPQGGAGSNSPGAGQAPVVTQSMIGGAPSDGGRAFMGGGRSVATRNAGATRRGGKAFWSGSGRKVDSGGESTEEAPPHFSKPGALIRTTGQQPLYEKAETRTHTVDAGEIVFNKRKGIDVGRAPTLQHGPADTPPPPNPISGASRSGGGAAANSAGPSGNGGSNNNGSGNNDKDKPGDDDDGHGGDRARDTAFNDAF